MSPCTFPGCPTLAPHDMHLFHEKSSPLGMRVEGRAVNLWLPDGTLIKRRQPDAVRQLRMDVRAWEAK